MGGGGELTSQPWATPEVVLKMHDDFVAGGGTSSSGQEGDGPAASGSGQLETGTREILDKMTLYLDDAKTVNVLLPPIQGEVLEHYTTFYNFVKSEYDFATANAVTPPARIRNRLQEIAGSTGGGSGGAGWSKARQG